MHFGDRLKILELGVSFGGVWADLGCGEGAFTLALAQLVGHEDARIHAVDRDARALNAVTLALRARWPRIQLETHFADLATFGGLPALDGALLAFTLGDIPKQAALLARVRTWLRPGGRLVVVEYDGGAGDPMVPHPCAWKQFQHMATDAGFTKPRLTGWVQSRFATRVYGAACDAKH